MISTEIPKAVLDAYAPGSWVEQVVINYARKRLEEDAGPGDVLAELDAARHELADWMELEQRYGITEVGKLLIQWLTANWGEREVEKMPAAAWIARLDGSPIDERDNERRRAADAVFNLWPGLNPNYGLPRAEE